MPRRLGSKPTIDLESLDIGTQIASHRKHKGFTQQALAQKIGITQTLLSDYETGRVRIYAEMLIRISIALNISLNALLDMEETSDAASFTLRMSKRIQQINALPEHKRKAILKTLDDLIRANAS